MSGQITHQKAYRKQRKCERSNETHCKNADVVARQCAPVQWVSLLLSQWVSLLLSHLRCLKPIAKTPMSSLDNAPQCLKRLYTEAAPKIGMPRKNENSVAACREAPN